MTIVQMLYFQAVCKFENFTKAAENQHISQPAMSAAMHDLEMECGVPLFRKSRNSLTITDEGWMLLTEIEENLRQYDHLMHVVKNLSLSRKYVRLGFSTFLGNLEYPRILAEFSRRHQDTQIISVEKPTGTLFDMLNAGKLDVVLAGRTFDDLQVQAAFDSAYHIYPVVSEQFVFSIHRSHPLASRVRITPEEIATVPLVMLEDKYTQTQILRSFLENAGVAYHILHQTDQMYTIARFVEQGVAGGFLPASIADNHVNIVGIPFWERQEQLKIFWKKDQFLFSSTKSFISLVKELYPKSR